jgi:hypothetical protein
MLKLALALASSVLGAQELSDETFEKWHAYVLPKDKDAAWRAIPWRPVFWDAVVEAQERDMPVFLWGMNGHPLACT